jgi:hypothetical protein
MIGLMAWKHELHAIQREHGSTRFWLGFMQAFIKFFVQNPGEEHFVPEFNK